MLGCDSLAVTRIVRALYSSHHGIFNSRTLGGKHGALDADGPFAVRHVFESRNLGEYVNWLDRHNVCQSKSVKDTSTTTVDKDALPKLSNSFGDDSMILYECLLEAISLGHIRIALSLLAFGINPMLSEHGGRLAKVAGRMAMRSLFKANPVHLSCIQGQPVLVQALLAMGFSCKSPDANGSFPIHHVCLNSDESTTSKLRDVAGCSVSEGANRSQCLHFLLHLGKAPITTKDGNKQTILHCVARTGDTTLTQYAIDLWKEGGKTGQVPTTYGVEYGGIWDWRDRWYRTPVHWAVLNGHLSTLELLLEAGCDPSPPPSRRPNRSTSAENETPMQICDRLFLKSSDIARREKGKYMEKLMCKYAANKTLS
jgi:hypothetical protein